MHLVVSHELNEKIEQEVEFKLSTRSQIAAIYPYLLMYNKPHGNFKFLLKKNNKIIFEKAFTSSDIQESINTTSKFIHVYFPIIPDSPVMIEKGIYSLVLESENYLYSNNSYIAWLQEYERIDGENQNASELPLSFRVKEYEKMSRVLNFADGFTSENPPVLAGGSLQDIFDVPNGANDFELIELDENLFTSAFIDYEVKRKDDNFNFKSVGSLVITFKDDEWEIHPSNYIGDDLLQDEITLNEHVLLKVINNETKMLAANIGIMGANHETKIKFNTTRILK